MGEKQENTEASSKEVKRKKWKIIGGGFGVNFDEHTLPRHITCTWCIKDEDGKLILSDRAPDGVFKFMLDGMVQDHNKVIMFEEMLSRASKTIRIQGLSLNTRRRKTMEMIDKWKYQRDSYQRRGVNALYGLTDTFIRDLKQLLEGMNDAKDSTD